MKKNRPFQPQVTNVQIIETASVTGNGNWSIQADIDGKSCKAAFPMNDMLRYSKADESLKPFMAMELACEVFDDKRNALLTKYGKKQSVSELLFHLWNSTGRKLRGEENEVCVCGRHLNLDDDEYELSFDVFDGFAVASYEGKEYVMLYPTVRQVLQSSHLYQEVENYVGQAVIDTGVVPNDILLTLGEIIYSWPLSTKLADI